MAIQPFPFSPSYGVSPQTTPAAPTQTAPIIPEGLLGSTPDYRSLLSDANRFAGQQGLYATLMGLARPVRRGESRLMGAMQMGQEAAQAARQQKLGDLSTQMKFDELDRKRKMEAMRLQALRESQQRISGAGQTTPAIGAGGMQPMGGMQLTTFNEYQIQQMDPNQKSLAAQSEQLQQEATRLQFLDPDTAKMYQDRAADLREQATGGLLSRSDAVGKEENLRKEFVDSYVSDTNEIIQRRNSLIELLKQGGPVSKYLTFVSAIKTVEPNSAVLSSEYESAQALSGLLTRLQTQLEKIEGNKPLPEQFRIDMENVGNLMSQAAMDHYNKGRQQYEGIAQRQRLNPQNVIIDPTDIRQTSALTTPEVQNPAGALRQSRTRGGVGQQ